MTAERSQHTPGQLWADEALFCQKHDDAPGYWFCRIFRAPLVAGQIRTIFCEIERPTKEHAELDARLIAAAPELLAFLKKALVSLETASQVQLHLYKAALRTARHADAEGHKHSSDSLKDEIFDARAAIAKAEGKAP